ncbi:hypothetical protein nbrc107696_31070 [Gordonia spumicola]|uniref:Uncharacterized protein n=1 Tax=Gordonia spumicola TaxID=589161 RepID=A0A7I9VBZ0_9ACTN|nr:hypothetical protein [Gordonia spumicola]GEE02661.1 hypothetical protein nbrc107696_31070 [Gordonia spumicola]
MSRRERKALKNLQAQQAAQAKFDAEQAKKAEKQAKQQAAQAAWEAKSPEEKKQTYKVMAAVAVVVVVLFGIMAACNSGDDDKAAPATDTTAELGEPPVETSASDLGAEVEAALLNANGVTSFTELRPTSPGWGITSIDTMGDDTVRVHVQELMSESAKKKTGSWTMKMTCSEVPALDTVVVRDISGIDTNVFKFNIGPMPNGC